MREILFRGKAKLEQKIRRTVIIDFENYNDKTYNYNIKKGEWVEGLYVQRIYEDELIHTIQVHKIEKYRGKKYHIFIEIDIDPATIGQYTGLYDNNGVKIFEGDIVYNDEGEFSFTSKVEYSQWQYVLIGIYDNYELEDFVDNDSVDVEKIGNVHDNPELLEEK